MRKKRKPPKELQGFSEIYEIRMRFTGLYFLYDEDELVYIGQSVDVHSRIHGHIKEGVKIFNKAYFLPFDISKLDGAEEALVRMFRPKYNKTVDGSFRSGRRPSSAIPLHDGSLYSCK